MTYRHHTRIQRRYDKTLFAKRSPYLRLLVIAVLLALIVALPLLILAERDRLQLEALRAFRMSPTSTPFASERFMMAQDYAVRGNIEEALSLYALAAEQQPNNISYLYEYGRVLIESDRYEEARALGERILTLDSNDPRGYALVANSQVWSNPAGAIPVALTGTELGIPYAPLNSALAIAYTNIGRYQEALQRGDLAIRQDPYDAGARRAFSYPLIFTGRYNEAIEQLEQAIAINPNVTAPYFELASLYRRINQSEMAVAIYNRVLEIDPTNERAFLRLCETYAAKGLFREGEPFCSTALDLNPAYADAYRMQGQIRYSRRNYEGAIQSFQTCVDLGSQAIECYYIRGLAHYYLGQCDDAWRILNEALVRVTQDQIKGTILTGLTLVTTNCVAYRGQALPTPIPPTPIPPTPIGG
jgi:tetratricopeptide (TPR) repeat protein